MANKATTKTTTKAKETTVVEPTEKITEEIVVKEEKKKKYEPEDLIPCKSIVSGGLYVEGPRSKFTYSWADYDDIAEIEYRDLEYLIRSNSVAIYEPRLIILDDYIVSSNRKIEDLYSSLYSIQDLRDILELPVSNMEKVISNLPNGAVNSLKGLVATMIDSKQLDSVSRIKSLDEIFGTNMLLTLAQE